MLKALPAEMNVKHGERLTAGIAVALEELRMSTPRALFACVVKFFGRSFLFARKTFAAKFFLRGKKNLMATVIDAGTTMSTFSLLHSFRSQHM